MQPLTNFHLVLDLDSTLIHSMSEMADLKKLELYTRPENADLRERIYTIDMIDVMGRPGSGVRTRMWGVFRPQVFEFLDFARGYFTDIHVWSAGRYKYVHSVVERLFPSRSLRPATIFTYDDCLFDGDNIYKPLIKLHQAPRVKGADLTNTLSLDDRDDTFSMNPQNGILIPRYEPGPDAESIRRPEYSLSQLANWLMLPEVRTSTDVRTLDKTRIFTPF